MGTTGGDRTKLLPYTNFYIEVLTQFRIKLLHVEVLINFQIKLLHVEVLINFQMKLLHVEVLTIFPDKTSTHTKFIKNHHYPPPSPLKNPYQ